MQFKLYYSAEADAAPVPEEYRNGVRRMQNHMIAFDAETWCLYRFTRKLVDTTEEAHRRVRVDAWRQDAAMQIFLPPSPETLIGVVQDRQLVIFEDYFGACRLEEQRSFREMSKTRQAIVCRAFVAAHDHLPMATTSPELKLRYN